MTLLASVVAVGVIAALLLFFARGQGSREDELVVIASNLPAAAADEAKALLSNNGIDCKLVDDPRDAPKHYIFEHVGGIRVLVARADADLGGTILRRHLEFYQKPDGV